VQKPILGRPGLYPAHASEDPAARIKRGTAISRMLKAATSAFVYAKSGKRAFYSKFGCQTDTLNSGI